MTSKISTILPHDNHGFLDANFQINNAEHGENKLEETVGPLSRPTYPLHTEVHVVQQQQPHIEGLCGLCRGSEAQCGVLVGNSGAH